MLTSAPSSVTTCHLLPEGEGFDSCAVLYEGRLYGTFPGGGEHGACTYQKEENAVSYLVEKAK